MEGGYLKYVIENCEIALEELCRINEELRGGMNPDSNADVSRLGAYNRMIQDYLLIRIAVLFDKGTRTVSFINSFPGNSVVKSAQNEKVIQYILGFRNKIIAHSEKEWLQIGNFPITDEICDSNLKGILRNLKSLVS